MYHICWDGEQIIIPKNGHGLIEKMRQVFLPRQDSLIICCAYRVGIKVIIIAENVALYCLPLALFTYSIVSYSSA